MNFGLLSVSLQSQELPRAKGEIGAIVPEVSDSFLEGLWVVVKACVRELDPALQEAGAVCLKVSAIVILTLLVKSISEKNSLKALDLASAVAVGCTLLAPSASMIRLGEETVRALSEYGKLLIPVMTGAMAAQGGRAASAGLYAVTAFLDSVLSSVLSGLILPVLYIFLGLSIANAAIGQPILAKLRDFSKWIMTWVLKTVLYVFTGFLSITGVVSGATDAAAMKAAKITISGAVPVVGSILSDASEAVLVGAGLLRSSAGVYGLLTIVALYLTPFFQIGCQYLLLKATGTLCGSLSGGAASKLVLDFAGAMGLILAVTAVQTVLLLISTVCFMRGVG